MVTGVLSTIVDKVDCGCMCWATHRNRAGGQHTVGFLKDGEQILIIDYYHGPDNRTEVFILSRLGCGWVDIEYVNRFKKIEKWK